MVKGTGGKYFQFGLISVYCAHNKSVFDTWKRFGMHPCTKDEKENTINIYFKQISSSQYKQMRENNCGNLTYATRKF